MHTATQLDVSMFAIEIDGAISDRQSLLPGWGPYDRLGVVVHEPFGGVGASLLVQLAITAFYDHRPARRTSAPQYPEIYLFHVGGAYGSHSFFDYWPPRKEVFVRNDAQAVLTALNDKAITRLVVADGEPTPGSLDPWEPPAAGDRISSAFAYSASGRVANADVRLSSSNERAEANATMTLHPDRALARLMSSESGDPELASREPAVVDRRRFAELFASRIGEVDPAAMRSAADRRVRLARNGVITETYRRISVGEALGLLSTG